jgi:glycerophosphoryl diester phosphodiesterase
VRAACERLRDHPARDRIEILSFWTEACEVAAELGFRVRLVVIAGHQIPALALGASHRTARRVRGALPLTPALVETLRAAGLSVTTGTVNHAALLARLLRLDLDAITSDSPHELRAALGGAGAFAVAA